MDLRTDNSRALPGMPEPGGEKPVSAPAFSSVAWATSTFAPLNMTWKEAPAKFPSVRVLGTTADQQALMDVTIRRGKVVRASAVVSSFQPAHMLVCTFLLAVLVEKATLPEADAWLSRALKRLRRDKPSEVTAPWHQWRVTLTTTTTTTTIGLLTMQVR